MARGRTKSISNVNESNVDETDEGGIPAADEETPILDHEQVFRHQIRWKVDLRLCTIAGILCSLNLVDSGIISAAAVTSMIDDLSLHGNRFSLSIFIFTLSSITFQLPSTLAVRFIGPRIWFSMTTVCFGLITIATAFVKTWQQMIGLRVLLGISMSGIFPGIAYLISTWYTRQEQQLRFAYLETAEVFVLATGIIVNFALNQLDGKAGLRGWQWMFLVQGMISFLLGIITYWWMVDFPEKADTSFRFLNESEARLATERIEFDRQDVVPDRISWSEVAVNFLDIKLYAFCSLFFLINLVTTSLSYFLPIILQSGMGFSPNKSILLSSPPYYFSIIPALLTSLVGDKYRLRGPTIIFNALCLIAGFLMLGVPSSKQVTVRYLGTFLATGAYMSNWAALNAYQANNIAGQWKRATFAAAITATNGLGGIAGSFIVRPTEAPTYVTAIWVSIGSHILMIAIVMILSIFFYIANRQQAKGAYVIENRPGFRYTY